MTIESVKLSCDVVVVSEIVIAPVSLSLYESDALPICTVPLPGLTPIVCAAAAASRRESRAEGNTWDPPGHQRLLTRLEVPEKVRMSDHATRQELRLLLCFSASDVHL